MTQDVVSFVLRFVREASQEQEARWRGIIKHVQGDNESHFTQFAEALEFMQSHVSQVILSSFDEVTGLNESTPSAASAQAPFLETARLWGETMPQYANLMLETVKEVMATPFASATMAQQAEHALSKAWSTWSLATPAEQDKTAAELESVLAQLAALQAKVSQLAAEIAAIKKP